MKDRLPVLCTLLLFLLLAACGQTGPLYLPGDDEPERTLDAEQEEQLDEETQETP